MEIEYQPGDAVSVEKQDPKHEWKFGRRPATGMIEVYRFSRDGTKVFKAFPEAQVCRKSR